MADTITTYPDGSSKWMAKPPMPLQPDAEAPGSYENILTMNLISCDIKSDVVGESWKIVHDGVFIQQFMNDGLSNWKVSENILTLYFDDGSYYRLLFVSIYEAMLADARLFLITNGKSIVGCNDASLYSCGGATITGVIFT